jgi:hypothetical protein
MSKILEMAQLVDQHGMPEMQIRRRGIESRLDPQRPSGLQPVKQFGFDQQFFRAPPDLPELFFHRAHAILFCLGCF